MHGLSQALAAEALLPGSEPESAEGRLVPTVLRKTSVSAAGTSGTLRLCLLLARHVVRVPEALKMRSWGWF